MMQGWEVENEVPLLFWGLTGHAKSMANFQTLLCFMCFLIHSTLSKAAWQRAKVIMGETRDRSSIS